MKHTATGNARKDGRMLTYEEGIDRKMIEDTVVSASNTPVVAVPTMEEQQVDGEIGGDEGHNEIGINGDAIGM